MNQTLKIKLLKRKFQSLEYIEKFIENYQHFLQTGLDGLEIYQKYRKANPDFIPSDYLLMEENFWEHRAKPNFYGMLRSSEESLSNFKAGKKSTVGALAGDFRGLSRGFDGIEEEFMDIASPELRKRYLKLYKQTSRQADNVAKTINERWKDSSILKETITGPIDEQDLLKYLEPDEKLDE